MVSEGPGMQGHGKFWKDSRPQEASEGPQPLKSQLARARAQSASQSHGVLLFLILGEGSPHSSTWLLGGRLCWFPGMFRESWLSDCSEHPELCAGTSYRQTLACPGLRRPLCSKCILGFHSF